VKPAARGNGIADRLLDVQEEYARSCGVEWIYLDTHDGLKVAVALYERRGYQRCKRYNDNPQATLFMCENFTKRALLQVAETLRSQAPAARRIVKRITWVVRSTSSAGCE
jgi:N-acetylglutamate synthase-like GNAT family acetyltransferase